ncbi:hypothetical protein ONA24_05625 [Mycoplasmopsis cynos]|uniref:hypothetical protein n=1 Tax=Mycoplasmopsis cynos TaxID=171284 RepID=UPI0024C66D28|nr:hypothetical protein [Mycoplasmopsis cynos]WAM09472.1 hypothetical protein ONA24_05625 [Mycoplasmopsis cynos]
MGASIVACSPKEEKGQDPKAPEADKKDPKTPETGEKPGDTQSTPKKGTPKQSPKWKAPDHGRVPSGTELLGIQDNINNSISEEEFNRQIQGSQSGKQGPKAPEAGEKLEMLKSKEAHKNQEAHKKLEMLKSRK